MKAPSYLLIGSGRLAKHLRFYLENKSVSLATWSRRSEKDLSPLISNADVVLLAIADQALPEWIDRLCSSFNRKKVVHFSGAKSFPGAIGLHPLMTFTDQLYPAEFYEKLPFVAERKSDFVDIFPALHNPVYEIKPEQKPLYHALCHMTLNLPALLWVQIFDRFEKKLGMPIEILRPFLEKGVSNTMTLRERGLAGPLVRGDWETIRLHQSALAGDSLSEIYDDFAEWTLHQKERQR